MEREPILDVRNLQMTFHSARGYTVEAVRGVSFQIRRGEIFGLVGESGSGKSTIGKCLAGLYRPASGEICFSGRRVQLVFQDASAALSPRMTIGQSVMEPLAIHHTGSRSSRKARAMELLQMVGLEERSFYELPSDFSGGQQQRACIARALALEPDFLIADEPVASLDVSIQAQMTALFRNLRETAGLSILFIAHDLSLVRNLCDTVGVMKDGALVETAPADRLFEQPEHPYTQALLSAAPVPDPRLSPYRKER